MFKVTRVVGSLTNIGRKAVKQTTQANINLAQAGDEFAKVKDFIKSKAPYSKNVFTRVWNWVKEFVGNFKEVITAIKTNVAEAKKSLGDKFSKKNIKEAIEKVVEEKKAFVADIKEKLQELVKKEPV